jgi:hypothetical protein
MSIKTKATTTTTTGFAIIVVVLAAALFGTTTITTIVTSLGLHIINFAFAQQQQQQPQTFTAKLSGSNEAPPVTTSATGMAQFQLTADGSQINYKLNATNLNNFMMAHIHQGKAGENGQPVVPLSMGSGKITASDLQGPLAGKQLSDLINLMKTGGTYTNIHTQTNQNGEIRGQISP